MKYWHPARELHCGLLPCHPVLLLLLSLSPPLRVHKGAAVQGASRGQTMECGNNPINSFLLFLSARPPVSTRTLLWWWGCYWQGVHVIFQPCAGNVNSNAINTVPCEQQTKHERYQM